MRSWKPSRAGALAVALAAAVAATACASSGAWSEGAGSEAATTAGEAAASAEPPVIQIRDFPGAARVTVVAWSPGAPTYGLRGHVNQEGALVGGPRHGDHGLYVGVTHVNGMGGFTRASIVPVPPGPVLQHGRPMADDQACNRGDDCAPQSIVTVQMSDALLRQAQDSLVVTFSGGRYMDWSVVLDRPLIDAYLRAVDSVAATRQSQ